MNMTVIFSWTYKNLGQVVVGNVNKLLAVKLWNNELEDEICRQNQSQIPIE